MTDMRSEIANDGDDKHPLRILIVDDNEASALTLGWAIEAEGYEVRTVFSGKAALEEMPRFHPHIVLLDLGMPGMTGLDVCRALRADPKTSHIKIIAQTGWSDEGARKKTAETGFDLHLVKPVNIPVLHDMLDLLASSITVTPRPAGQDCEAA